MKAVLIRLSQLSNDNQTCGRFILIDDKGKVVFQTASLELPWKGNTRNISCIPVGHYKVDKVNSSKFGADTFSVNDVPGRTYIRIHPGNYTSQIRGCILLGKGFANLNGDTITDIVQTRSTINRLKEISDEFELTIIQI